MPSSTPQNGLLSAADLCRLEECASQIPPFLFRAYACKGSRGVNNEYEMRPSPTATFPRRSILARSHAEIRLMLRAHLLWQYFVDSDFISWSSSILWVLEHAARMHTYESNFKSDVYIAVLDTRKIHDMALFPATMLMDVYNLPEPNDPKAFKLKKEYYTSEYLFYGPLRNFSRDPCYRPVRWEDLCGADVHDMLSIFSQRSSREAELCRRIEEHRRRFESKVTPVEIQHVVPLAVLLGGLFGEEFQVVVTIALTTLVCGNQTPSAAELRQTLKKLLLKRPVDVESIIRFDFSRFIHTDLTEVMRMYQKLTDVLAFGIAQQSHGGLVEELQSLSIRD